MRGHDCSCTPMCKVQALLGATGPLGQGCKMNVHPGARGLPGAQNTNDTPSPAPGPLLPASFPGSLSPPSSSFPPPSWDSRQSPWHRLWTGQPDARVLSPGCQWWHQGGLVQGAGLHNPQGHNPNILNNARCLQGKCSLRAGPCPPAWTAPKSLPSGSPDRPRPCLAAAPSTAGLAPKGLEKLTENSPHPTLGILVPPQRPRPVETGQEDLGWGAAQSFRKRNAPGRHVRLKVRARCQDSLGRKRTQFTHFIKQILSVH